MFRTPAIAQVLEEFYRNLSSVGVSAITGKGMSELFAGAEACRQEYIKDYKPDVDKKRKVWHPCACWNMPGESDDADS